MLIIKFVLKPSCSVFLKSWMQLSPDQTCSVPGRSILSNVTLLRDILDYIEHTGETGILISLDQEKRLVD